jgi:hemoglobin/transferrin/lactoferrin receptor protein
MSRTALRNTTALVVALTTAIAMPAAAQDTNTQDQGPGFLGYLFLTGGKRDLAIGSAVPQTVIDEEELQDRQASTVAQLIDSVPGVTLVNGNTPQGSGINIRGFGANNTFGNDQKIAIIVDGATTGSEELYRIGTQLFTDPLLYRKATVLRGTIGSFAYGSGIVGGVVKMETKDASDFTNGEVGLSFGQTVEFSSNGKGYSSSTTLAWQPTENAELLLNYTLRDAENYESGDGTEIENSDFRTPSVLAKGRVSFGQDNDHALSFSYTNTVADDKDKPYDQFATSSGAFGNVDRLTDTTQATLKYEYNPLDNDLIDFSATLSHADQKIEYDYVDGSSPLQGTPSFPFLVNTVNAKQRYETTKLTFANTALFDTGAISHELNAGVEFSRRKRKDNEAASAPGGEDNRFALYLIDEMSIGNWTVTPAMRYESAKVDPANSAYDTYENEALMGGLALAYDFGNGFSVFGSAAYTEGMPIIDDLGGSDFSDYKMSTTEKSHTFELGASYAGEGVFRPGDSLAVRGNIYKTTMWDITSYTAPNSAFSLPDGATRIPTTPLERVEVQGFELEASYGLESGLYFDLNANISEGREHFPDHAFGQPTILSNTSGRDWRILSADTAQLTIGKKFEDYADLSWEAAYGTDRRNAAGDDLKDVTIHTLRGTYRPQTGVLDGAEIRFGIENVFDTDYVGHLSSDSRKAPGRTFKLGVSMLF